MADMLVKLYDLPSGDLSVPPGIIVRRALGPEKDQVLAWVARSFSQGWADECEFSFARPPIACFLALKDQVIVGFCAYDATARGLLGPIGVTESHHGQGIGRCLLLAALRDMTAQGYAYAVIGWVGPETFFAKTVNALPIPDSSPGLYRDRLPDTDSAGPSD